MQGYVNKLHNDLEQMLSKVQTTYDIDEILDFIYQSSVFEPLNFDTNKFLHQEYLKLKDILTRCRYLAYFNNVKRVESFGYDNRDLFDKIKSCISAYCNLVVDFPSNELFSIYADITIDTKTNQLYKDEEGHTRYTVYPELYNIHDCINRIREILQLDSTHFTILNIQEQADNQFKVKVQLPYQKIKQLFALSTTPIFYGITDCELSSNLLFNDRHLNLLHDYIITSNHLGKDLSGLHLDDVLKFYKYERKEYDYTNDEEQTKATNDYTAYTRMFFLANFSNSILTNCKFEMHFSLEACNFDNTILSFTTFVETKLKESRFDNADLRGARFLRSRLYSDDKIRLRKAIMNHTHFYECSFASTDLSNLDLSFCTFEKCEFQNAENTNFYGANMKEAKLRGANLQGANFSAVNLNKANLIVANLQHTIFSKTKIKKHPITRFLTNGLLEASSTLMNANLQGADLKNADFKGAYLRDANLLYVKLGNTNLRGTKLSGAIGSEKQKMDFKKSGAKTRHMKWSKH